MYRTKDYFAKMYFSLTLQYLRSNKELKNNPQFFSFDGIDNNGVNNTGDKARHGIAFGVVWRQMGTAEKKFSINLKTMTSTRPILWAIILASSC